MKLFTRCSLVLVAATVSMNACVAVPESEQQKLGYIIGMDIGNSLREQGADIDLEALVDALRTTFNGEKTAITAEEAGAIRQAYMQKRQAEQQAEAAEIASTNFAEGQKFLAENKSKEGVQVTESGLQYKVLTMGDGAKPAATDTVKVHYRGSLIDGTEFDSSHKNNEPALIALTRVIEGWTEGIQLMPIGSKFMFYVPFDLAYGEAGGGPIPPSSTLIFEVELLDIETE
jgi:FKBP-type peptidyl-prolyl cis-trans isomerase